MPNVYRESLGKGNRYYILHMILDKKPTSDATSNILVQEISTNIEAWARIIFGRDICGYVNVK